MPKGQQAPLADRIAEQRKLVESKKKLYERAKEKLEKLEAEENNNMMQEIAKLAKEQKMSVGDYLKSHLMTQNVTVELKKAKAEAEE